MNAGRPVRIAIVNDYEIVVKGLLRMFEAYADRIAVVEIAAGTLPDEAVDIALFDSFSHTRGAADEVQEVLRATRAAKVVVYSWNLGPELVEQTLRKGASGYLAKRSSAEELVAALERIHAGEVVVSADDTVSVPESGDWPGRRQGLTTRESEIIALITQGLSNQQIADRAFLSINSVKSYIRSSYRKMAVTSRSRAVLWGIEHGFRPDQARITWPLERDEV